MTVASVVGRSPRSLLTRINPAAVGGRVALLAALLAIVAHPVLFGVLAMVAAAVTLAFKVRASALVALTIAAVVVCTILLGAPASHIYIGPA